MDLRDVAALVLTHRRPQLATDVVRRLVQEEGFAPERVLLVVNGEGGLVDSALEASIRVLTLPENLGPAGGYREGLRELCHTTTTTWVYLCEDDVGLFDLPAPRVKRVIEAVGRRPDAHRIGAVVAYGRDLEPGTGFAGVHKPTMSDFDPVDVAPWGATLLSRAVVEAGVLPDAAWFFGFEDFDFWLRVKAAGFTVLVDNESARVVANRATGPGRDSSFSGRRPTDIDEPWRSYYLARNFLELRRRWGRPYWTVSHLIKSGRRLQLAPSLAHRRALLAGLRDGFLGRMGRNNRFVREQGEI